METTFTLIVFTVFVSIFLWIGALAAQVSDKMENDYLLGNRTFGRVFVGLSAGASGNSAWIMLGTVSFAYTTGIASFLILIPMFLGELAFWTLFSDKVNQLSIEQGSQTIPEFLGTTITEPQGKRLITLIVGLIAFCGIGAYICGQFSAAAKTLNAFFDVDYHLGIPVSASLILIYCVSGGLRASIWTDVVQTFVVMFVSFGMLILAVIDGGGVPAIISQLNAIDPDLLNLTAGYDLWSFFFGMLGLFLFGFGFDISQPHVLVRLMACRSPEETKRARWVYLGYVYSTWAAMLFFGVICRVLIPDIDDPEQILPFYAMQHLHPVLIGIVLAGIYSVIASTADSQLLVCSSALARDISPSLHRRMSRYFGTKFEQVVTLLVGITAIVITLNLSASIFSSIVFAAGTIVISIGPAMLVVLLQRRSSTLALSLTMLVGVMITILWAVLGFDDILFSIFPGFGLVLGFLLHELLMLAWFK
jgi:sodium/proline symporter